MMMMKKTTLLLLVAATLLLVAVSSVDANQSYEDQPDRFLPQSLKGKFSKYSRDAKTLVLKISRASPLFFRYSHERCWEWSADDPKTNRGKFQTVHKMVMDTGKYAGRRPASANQVTIKALAAYCQRELEIRNMGRDSDKQFGPKKSPGIPSMLRKYITGPDRTGVYTCKVPKATALYFTWNMDEWYWTPDRSLGFRRWQSMSVIEVKRGLFKGRKPAAMNIAIMSILQSTTINKDVGDVDWHPMGDPKGPEDKDVGKPGHGDKDDLAHQLYHIIHILHKLHLGAEGVEIFMHHWKHIKEMPEALRKHKIVTKSVETTRSAIMTAYSKGKPIGKLLDGMGKMLSSICNESKAIEASRRYARIFMLQARAYMNAAKKGLQAAKAFVQQARFVSAVAGASRLVAVLTSSKLLALGKGALKFVANPKVIGGIMVVAAIVEGIHGYHTTNAKTQGGKIVAAVGHGAVGLLIMKNPLIALADLLAPKEYKLSSLLKGGVEAVLAIGEGLLTGDTRAMDDFHKRSKNGDYGVVMKHASLAGDWWAEKGLVGGLSQAWDDVTWLFSGDNYKYLFNFREHRIDAQLAYPSFVTMSEMAVLKALPTPRDRFKDAKQAFF